MKTRRSMLSRIWSKCFPSGKPSQAEAAKPLRLDRADGASKPAGSNPRPPRSGGIEMLEGRIAPATLVNPSTVVFIDLDGDEVTVKFSKPLFTQTGAQLETVLNDVFKFNTGSIVPAGSTTPDPGTPQQLQLIDLTKIPPTGGVGNPTVLAAGVSITVTAKKADTLIPGETAGEFEPGTDGVLDGDDRANIGAIIATSTANSFSLGKITIDGDLGQIDAGIGTSKVGVKALKVHSLGAVPNTQPANYIGSLESKIMGSLGSLSVETDVKGYINVVSGSGTKPAAVGKIGNITIGGTLEGGTADNSGTIQSATTIGKVKIGSGEIVNPQPDSTDDTESTTSVGITDGIKGGTGKNTGVIAAGGKIASVQINGDLQGGGGENSGTIRASGDIGAVKIGAGVEGHGMIGGSGLNSGSIQGTAKLASLTVNGDMIGGSGSGSASVVATGAIGKVMVDGDIKTIAAEGDVTPGTNSARIYTRSDLGNVTVTGNLEGGTTTGNGMIRSDGKMGVITIEGDLIGGGAGSGGIFALGALKGVNIDGDLRGGSGIFSGFVQSEVQIGFVKIGGDLAGNTENAIDRTGIITATGSIGEVSIGGSVIGGKGESSGSIQAAISGQGSLDKVTIGKQLKGGDGVGSGTINSGTKIGSVTINGAGSEVAIQGGKGHFSAAISSASTIGSVKITGDVVGGEGNNSASIQSKGLIAKLSIEGDLAGGKGIQSGSILSQDIWDEDIAGDLGKISISGTLTAGEGARSGRIAADGDLKSLTLGGIDVGTFETGGPGAGSAMVVTGQGFVHQGDAGSIAVKGSLNGRGDNHTLLEIQGSLGSLSATNGIVDGDIHIAGNLGKFSVGVPGKKGVEANLENVVLTAGGIAPATAKLATAIASITVNGDVINSQILAGYNVAGVGTNGDAQIGTVKVSGDWKASDLVAGIQAVNGEFGDGDDEVIAGGSDAITSRIANVIIGGTVSGTADPTTDHFGFVAEQIVKFKSGSATLPDDVKVRPVPIA